MTERILLSILVPAYCYPEGVEKILARLPSCDNNRVECIISDDSCDNSVQAIFEKYRHDLSNIEYIKNSPSLGAVKNWNSLIAKASGEYLLLMHHDEFPLEETFVNDLLEFLDHNRNADVVLLKCYLVDNKNFSFLHSYSFFKLLVLKYFLPFILTKNIIGPTSAMVFKKCVAESFDENLTWFVDADFYYRVIKKSKVMLSANISVGSTLDRADSITSSIKDNIKIIRNSELSYLSKKYSNQNFWIHRRFSNVYFVVLFFLWGVTRAFGRFAVALKKRNYNSNLNARDY